MTPEELEIMYAEPAFHVFSEYQYTQIKNKYREQLYEKNHVKGTPRKQERANLSKSGDFLKELDAVLGEAPELEGFGKTTQE